MRVCLRMIFGSSTSWNWQSGQRKNKKNSKLWRKMPEVMTMNQLAQWLTDWRTDWQTDRRTDRPTVDNWMFWCATRVRFWLIIKAFFTIFDPFNMRLIYFLINFLIDWSNSILAASQFKFVWRQSNGRPWCTPLTEHWRNVVFSSIWCRCRWKLGSLE